MCGLILPLALTPGCFNSESDYERLVEENNNLSAELAKATRENEILTQALNNIKQEQESLQLLLNESRSRLAEGGQSPGAASQASGETPAFSWDGWDWTPPPDAFDPPAETPQTTAQTRPEPAAPAGERIYRPKSGDTLYTIARRNNTTLEALLELNPQLRRRNNYMIWETDKIKLP